MSNKKELTSDRLEKAKMIKNSAGILKFSDDFDYVKAVKELRRGSNEKS